MGSSQYDLISSVYSGLINIDPSKQYVQYPEALRLLGSLEGKFVLDVGCGNGILSRIMARRGAKVVGYDISEEQIRLALEEEKINPLGIRYYVSSRRAGFSSLEWVDLRVSDVGFKDLGSAFWSGYEEDCPYVGFVCRKD